jgi:hypothetical protein
MLFASPLQLMTLLFRCQGRNPLELVSSSQTLNSPYQAALHYKALSLQFLAKLLTKANIIITEALVLCVSRPPSRAEFVV